jgi:predicted site-specific integrase-resolvase
LNNLINITSAAKIYRVAESTIYRWVKEDKIKSIRIKGQKNYDLDALQKAYDSRHRN